MYEDIPDAFSQPGTFQCAGHFISRKTFRCTKATCDRSIDDILSDAPYMKAGSMGVACHDGSIGLNNVELETLLACYASRSKRMSQSFRT